MLITARDSLMAQALGEGLIWPGRDDVRAGNRVAEQVVETKRHRSRRDQALALAEEVGYLPLALELTAAQVADGVPWAELLEDLRAEVAQLEALDLPEQMKRYMRPPTNA